VRELLSAHLGYEILYSQPDTPVALGGEGKAPLESQGTVIHCSCDDV
jgi:hypothetical protein